MTTVASAVLFRSESKASGFHANECPEGLSFVLCFKVINYTGASSYVLSVN